jgi:glycine cleavage system aminomethyltransferase T
MIVASLRATDRSTPQLLVETPSHQTLDALVPQICLAAGAVLQERDGHTVAVSYGSAPGEIAVCMKCVGLADRSDYGVLELRGEQSLLDRALIARLGDPALAPGTARRMRSVWYMRTDQRRTLLVGPHPALASGPPIGKGRDRSDLPHKDIRATLAIISVIGPRAARLLAAAGLPGELAIGAVARDAGDASVVAILRESQRRFVLLVRAGAADALWTRLLAAGEPLGAAFVGLDALTLLGASSASSG